MVSTLPNAFDGDCVATWELTLEALVLATALTPASVYPAMLDTALRQAYTEAIGQFWDLMMSELASVLFDSLSGHWSSWGSQMETSSSEHTLFEDSGEADRSIEGSFALADRAGFIVVTDPPHPADPLAVTAVLLDPDDPEGTAETYDLGPWSYLHYVHAVTDAVFLAGSYFVDGERTAEGHGMILDRLDGRLRVTRYVGDAYLDLASAPHAHPVNHGAHLAVSTLRDIQLLPATSGVVPVDRPVMRSGCSGRVGG